MSLLPRIVSEIETHGPMPVDRYMGLCNSHYYATRDPLGRNGDFTTAPEISQIFGEMIAIWTITQWEKLGRPRDCALIELGPGRGTLMADILRVINRVDAFKPQVHFVETSPALRSEQKKTLERHHASSVEAVSWHDTFPKLGSPSILIANEFFDALPIKQFIGELERKVEFSGDVLHFNLPAESGTVREICPAAEEIIKESSGYCEAGIIIDYAYTAQHYNSTLQAVKGHRYHNVLETPGEADLTALVDFGRLAKLSQKACSITTQREFLLAHGADVRAKILNKEADLERLINPNQMGELFKVLCF